MSVLEIAQLHIKQGMAKELEAVAETALKIIAGAPGVGACRAMRCIEDPDTFAFLIEWKSLEAHQAFRESGAFQRYRSVIQHLFADLPEVRHYTPTAVVAVPDEP